MIIKSIDEYTQVVVADKSEVNEKSFYDKVYDQLPEGNKRFIADCTGREIQKYPFWDSIKGMLNIDFKTQTVFVCQKIECSQILN